MLTQLTYTRIDYKSKQKCLNLGTNQFFSSFFLVEDGTFFTNVGPGVYRKEFYGADVLCAYIQTSRRDPAKKERSVRGQFDRFLRLADTPAR